MYRVALFSQELKNSTSVVLPRFSTCWLCWYPSLCAPPQSELTHRVTLVTGVEVKEAGLATHYIASSAMHLIAPALAALGELASDHITVHQTLCDLEALYPPPGHEVLHSRLRPTATVGSTVSGPVVPPKVISSTSKLARRVNWIQHHFQHETMEGIVQSLQRAVTASAVAAASAGYSAGADGTIKLHGLLQESADFAAETLKVLSK